MEGYSSIHTVSDAITEGKQKKGRADSQCRLESDSKFWDKAVDIISGDKRPIQTQDVYMHEW
jgi:hypothetical protein